ncbi:MAG TPA: carbohydrate-binding protein, partial [Vicinamibacterales bacterium]
THVVKLVIDADGSGGTAADINWLAFATTSGGSTPYTGTPIALPGRIEAENYDKGGEGVAYHDTTPGNAGGVYRSDGVDLQVANDTGGGYKVKSAVAGEWLNYTVSVGATGTYSLDARVCSSGAGGTFHIEVDGVNVTGEMSIPNTGSWNSFTTITKTGVSLTAGTHVFKLVLDTNGAATGMTGNFNWFQIR